MNHGQRRLIGENELTACGCNPTDLVLVALSGGADSTALLLSFHELFQEGKIRGVFAAHLNHGIRGETAERDLRFCESLCERLSIPIATETADVPKRARERGESLEQAAGYTLMTNAASRLSDCAECVKYRKLLIAGEDPEKLKKMGNPCANLNH